MAGFGTNWPELDPHLCSISKSFPARSWQSLNLDVRKINTKTNHGGEIPPHRPIPLRKWAATCLAKDFRGIGRIADPVHN
jgi:hypothetical protein